MAEKYYNLSPYAYCANNPVNFVDPDGKVPFLANCVGALISATVEYGCQVVANLFTEEGSVLQAFVDVDIADIGIAAAEGFLTCGANVGRKIATKAAIEVAGMVLQNAVDVEIENFEYQALEVNSVGEIIVGTATDIICSSTMTTKGKFSPFETMSNTKAVNKTREALNSKGQSLDRRDADRIRNNNPSANKIKSALNNTISDEVNSMGAKVVSGVCKKHSEDKIK